MNFSIATLAHKSTMPFLWLNQFELETESKGHGDRWPGWVKYVLLRSSRASIVLCTIWTTLPSPLFPIQWYKPLVTARSLWWESKYQCTWSEYMITWIIWSSRTTFILYSIAKLNPTPHESMRHQTCKITKIYCQQIKHLTWLDF